MSSDFLEIPKKDKELREKVFLVSLTVLIADFFKHQIYTYPSSHVISICNYQIIK